MEVKPHEPQDTPTQTQTQTEAAQLLAFGGADAKAAEKGNATVCVAHDSIVLSN